MRRGHTCGMAWLVAAAVGVSAMGHPVAGLAIGAAVPLVALGGILLAAGLDELARLAWRVAFVAIIVGLLVDHAAVLTRVALADPRVQVGIAIGAGLLALAGLITLAAKAFAMRPEAKVSRPTVRVRARRVEPIASAEPRPSRPSRNRREDELGLFGKEQP